MEKSFARAQCTFPWLKSASTLLEAVLRKVLNILFYFAGKPGEAGLLYEKHPPGRPQDVFR